MRRSTRSVPNPPQRAHDASRLRASRVRTLAFVVATLAMGEPSHDRIATGITDVATTRADFDASYNNLSLGDIDGDGTADLFYPVTTSEPGTGASTIGTGGEVGLMASDLVSV